MILHDEFLVVGDDKTIIKSYEKRVNEFECLKRIAANIKSANIDNVIDRLSNAYLDEKFKIYEVFSEEINEADCPFIIGNSDELVCDLMKTVQIRNLFNLRVLKNPHTSLTGLDLILQRKIISGLNGILEMTAKKFLSIYTRFEKAQKLYFLQETLNQEGVLLSKNTDNSPLKHTSFLNDLKIKYSGSHVRVFFDGEQLIDDVYLEEEPFYFNPAKYKVIVSYYHAANLAVIQKVLNSFLKDRTNMKKMFFKRNIQLLKKTIQLEEHSIGLIENTIIPDLNHRKNSVIKNEDLTVREWKKQIEKIDDELNLFLKEEKEIKTFDQAAISLLDRKFRLNLLQNEITRMESLFI